MTKTAVKVKKDKTFWEKNRDSISLSSFLMASSSAFSWLDRAELTSQAS